MKHRVPIIITSLRPPAEVVSAVHGYGGIVFHDVINLRHAEKAAAQGVDGIIAVCAGAGGHAGLLSPFALVKQIREVYPGTIILSGAMSTRRRRAGGAGAGRGSGLSRHALHRDGGGQRAAGIQADADRQRAPRTSSTRRLFSGVRGNYLRGSVARTGLDPDNLPEADKTKMNFGTGGNTELKAWRDIWSAGQSVSGIHEVCERGGAGRCAWPREYAGGARAASSLSREREASLRLSAEQLPAALARGLAPRST